MSEHDGIIARLNTGIMRAKLATIPGHEADMRPALDELGSAIKVITQVLGRQAAQLAALRVGADTEDLHAAPAGQDDRIAALESEARRLALEEAAARVEAGLDDIEGSGNPGGEAEAIALMVRTMRRRAANIRALADKPAAGGDDA